MATDDERIEARRKAHEANVQDAMRVIVDEWILAERELRQHRALVGHSQAVIAEAWRRLYGLYGHDALLARIRRIDMTICEIAQALKISRRHLHRILAGDQRMSKQTADAMRKLIMSQIVTDPLYRFAMVIKEKQKTT